VKRKYGMVRTRSHPVHRCRGAFFNVSIRPSISSPSLPAGFRIRVDAGGASATDSSSGILTEPRNALIKQYIALN